MNGEMDALRGRVERLERRNRVWAMLGLAAILTSFGLGAARPVAPAPEAHSVTAPFTVTDGNGRVLLRVDLAEPTPGSQAKRARLQLLGPRGAPVAALEDRGGGALFLNDLIG